MVKQIVIPRPYWRNEETWICLNHVPPIKHHKSVINCTMSACRCKRPEKIKEHILSNVIKEASEKCKYYKCNKKRKEGRKYCSDKCRKDRARELYRIRQRIRKVREEENRALIEDLRLKIKRIELYLDKK